MKLPKLTLRDLFWLMALAAMGCGWWVERREYHARAAEAAQKAIQYEILEGFLNEQGWLVLWFSDGINTNAQIEHQDGGPTYTRHVSPWPVPKP